MWKELGGDKIAKEPVRREVEKRKVSVETHGHAQVEHQRHVPQ